MAIGFTLNGHTIQFAEAIALENQVSTGDGPWLDFRPYVHRSVHVTGANAGDVIDLRGSNADAPAAGDAGVTIITATAPFVGGNPNEAILVDTARPRWLKVVKRVAGGSPGNTSARIFAQSGATGVR